MRNLSVSLMNRIKFEKAGGFTLTPTDGVTLQRKGGFTLIEVLLVVALIGLLAGVGLPVFSYIQSKNNLDITGYSLAQALRRAQMLAQNGESEADWGVHIDPASKVITLFQGTNFASRSTEYDETVALAGSLDVSGLNEIVFNAVSGEPALAGTVNLGMADGSTMQITINAKGAVLY